MEAIMEENVAPEIANGNFKALTRGLEVLRLLVESTDPLTSTEIARKVGLHPSTVSRILKTLTTAGYVRKPDYHSFTVSYGVLTLWGNSINRLPLVTRPRPALIRLCDRCNGAEVRMATLWHGELIYFNSVIKGHDPTTPASINFPFHLSSVALRLLLDWPEKEALRALADSKVRYGWACPTPLAPISPEACLKAAREQLEKDCLYLQGWNSEQRFTASIPIHLKDEPVVTLAITGTTQQLSKETVLSLLIEGREEIEAAMRKT